MSDLEGRLAAALDVRDLFEAEARVHKVMVDQIEMLSPDAVVRSTGYFNHSFVPDFIIEWRKSKEVGRKDRSIYLRHSLLSSEAAGDLAEVSKSVASPMFVSIAPDDNVAVAERFKNRVKKKSQTLVTTAPALSTLADQPDATNPLLGVVQANLLRGGKGIVDKPAAERLALAPAEVATERLEEFETTVSANFTEEAQLQIVRVADIVGAALNIDGEDGDLSPNWAGKLSDTEMRELLPYLLGLEQVRENRSFWSALGTSLTLERLERMASALSDLDLTPLASASTGTWTATRSQVTRIEPASSKKNADKSPKAGETPPAKSAPVPAWAMWGRCLTATAGDWRVQFAYDGKKLKTPGSGVPARWADVRSNTDGFLLTRVELSGVSKNVVSKGETDMTADVESIIQSVDDSFHVPNISVQVEDAAESRTLDVSYTASRVVARSESTVGTMLRVSLGLLATKAPVADETVDALVGIEPEPAPEEE
jgi:hypothetical protein